jgi:hypothetical protein
VARSWECVVIVLSPSRKERKDFWAVIASLRDTDLCAVPKVLSQTVSRLFRLKENDQRKAHRSCASGF